LAEGLAFQPLDGAGERDVGRRGSLAVGADQIDLRVVLPVPPAADDLRAGQPVVGQQPLETGSDDGLDGAASPGRPGPFEPRGDQVTPATLDLGNAALQEREPEPQVRVLDPVALVLGVKANGQGSVDGDDALCRQGGQDGGEGAGGDRVTGTDPVGNGAEATLAGADRFQGRAAVRRLGNLPEQRQVGVGQQGVRLAAGARTRPAKRVTASTRRR
jgi:hypothetical protein